MGSGKVPNVKDITAGIDWHDVVNRGRPPRSCRCARVKGQATQVAVL